MSWLPREDSNPQPTTPSWPGDLDILAATGPCGSIAPRRISDIDPHSNGHRLYREHRLPFIRREVGAIRMVEDDGAHAGLRLHHHAFGQLDADIAGLEQLEHAPLIVQVGTRGIAEAVALAVVLRREAVVHGHGGGIGEAPIFADAAMQPLRRRFGGFDGQRLYG